MNGFDLIALIILLLSGVIAFFRGFVHEALSISAWVGAALATAFLLPFVQPYARGQIGNEWLADGVAGLAVFLITLITLSIATRALSQTIQDSALGGLDRSLGFVFGLIRGTVIVAAGLIILDFFYDEPADRPGWVVDARSLPVFDFTADVLRSFSPPDVQQMEEKASEAGKAVSDAIAAKKMLDALTQPEPAADPTDAEPDGGYSESERKPMDQLFESVTDEP